MRVRVWMCAAASTAVLVSAAPAPATAAPSVPVAARVAAARATHDPSVAAGHQVTLVTGERVHLSGPVGHEHVEVAQATVHGVLEVHRVPGHLYVYPAALEPYVGRSLDLSLFDLETAGRDGRTAVRIAYTGQRPAVPGVHVTSARGGVAQGYVTDSSAAAFGQAVRRAAAGVTPGGALFAGVRTIAAAHDTPPPVHPHYPMSTLRITVTTAAGKPQAEGELFLMNVDDGERYVSDAFVENGEARVSVPAGTYSLISDDFTEGPTEDTGTFTVATVNEYVVTGAGQTLAVDHRQATTRPSVTTPRPADDAGLFLEWDRTDAADSFDFGSGYFVGPGIDLLFAPSAPAKVGDLTVTQSWALQQPGASPTYAYSLAVLDDHLPAEGRRDFTASQLATVESTYYGDGSGSRAGWARGAEFDEAGGGGGFILPVARGTRQTEYAGATAPAQWSDFIVANIDAMEDPGFFDGDLRPLPAGSTTSETWFRGALGAGIPVQTGGGFCYACRSGNVLGVGLAPVTDSDPTHAGELFGAGDELPVARFRLYRGSKLVADEDDSTGTSLRTRESKKTYRAVVDVDRRGVEPRLSTRSRTELTFVSARGKGARLDEDDWYCEGGDTCRALPLLQARADLPTDLQEQLPLGRSTVTVRAAQVQGAASSPVVTATFEYRPAGYGWQSVELHPTAEGAWTGVIDTTEDPGSVADLRVGATDAAGSSVLQTVSRAFTVAAK